MKKITITILAILCAICLSSCSTDWLFSTQYNENGISHFLVVTIDESQPAKYIGKLDGHRIFVEGFNLKETNFRNVDAEDVSIKKAIDENLVSIDEWRKYAWKIKQDGDTEILIFDNYEIACAYDDCYIRPKSK